MTLKERFPAIAAASTLTLTLLAVVFMTSEEPNSHNQKVHLPAVSVLEIERSAETPSLTVQASSQARWPLQLRATSRARVDYLYLEIEPGQLVQKGEVLARLDTHLLESQLYDAQSTLKQAELNLQRHLHEQSVAKTMRTAASSSAFATMEPHIAAARAELKRAQHSVHSAQRLLDDAVIVAPYDGLITQRLVSPGEWVEAGQGLFELVASDSLDVHVPLSQRDWIRVMDNLEDGRITVRGYTGDTWPASVRYLSPLINETTRQRTLVLSISNPYLQMIQLRPNQQVTVRFELKAQDGLYELPLSAVDPDGAIWVVTEQQTLRRVTVTTLEVRADTMIVSLNEELPDAFQLVRYTLPSMVAGKRVEPYSETVRIADKLEAL
ncbi:efflux RND transporter periplasmic adaptor subunit [Pseudoalteromonas sp. PPB1]|uniref:efflux RND transporter periplasmic adaptor subunit n=1 Tax=Pseudoalteromonas sp. PPB1 TaxID=2756136 RepID=UPI001890FE11|nr:efflux RND transporter periplasmic adaptor subunit [Pseudoalteromonas sp. PPB1]